MNSWWFEKETQDITIDLIERFNIQIIMSDLNKNNEIIVKVVTDDGYPIKGFPLTIREKQVIFVTMDKL